MEGAYRWAQGRVWSWRRCWKMPMGPGIPRVLCWRREEVRAESRCEVRGQGQRRNMLPAQQRWRKGQSRGPQAPPELGARAADCPENLLDLRLTLPCD